MIPQAIMVPQQLNQKCPYSTVSTELATGEEPFEMRINRNTRLARVSIAILAGLTACGIGLKTNVVRGAESPQVIKITASRFQFSPNQITLHKDQPVTLQLISTDRTHGFLLRPFKIDTNIEAGKTKTITITPEAVGTFKAICDHYCGVGHGNMKMTIVVEDPQAKASGRSIASASNTVGK